MSSELKSGSKIILASSSTIRQKILEDSGIKFDTVSPEVDEDDLKKSQEDLEKLSQETTYGQMEQYVNFLNSIKF